MKAKDRVWFSAGGNSSDRATVKEVKGDTCQVIWDREVFNPDDTWWPITDFTFMTREPSPDANPFRGHE